jgi:hypothetical protein
LSLSGRLPVACSFLQPHRAELCQTTDTSVRRLERLQNKSDTAVVVCWMATCCRRVLQAITDSQTVTDGLAALKVAPKAYELGTKPRATDRNCKNPKSPGLD